MKKLSSTCLWLAPFILLVSCSGGGQVASGGTGGTGMTAVSRGPVAAIGSIWVNGVEYDTTGATITMPGEEFTDDAGDVGGKHIFEGMQVTVRGTINADGITGTADHVVYDPTLIGVTSNYTGSTFEIYGQTVILDSNTRPLDLRVDNDEWVEVSGYVLNGNVHATYVQKLTADPSAIEIEGIVTATTATTIDVGGANITVPLGFDTSTLVEGQSYVEVRADNTVTASAFTATSVVVKDTRLGGDEGDEAEVAGLISSLSPDATSFFVSGQRVLVGAGTRYVGGLATDLANGARVEVEGAIVAGNLVADEVEFEDSIELTDVISSVNMDLLSFNLGGTIIQAQLVSGSTEGYRSFSADETVSVRGRLDPSSGIIIARKIEEADDGNVELLAPLDFVAADLSTLTLMGIAISTSDLTFEANERTLTRDEFFRAALIGDLVEMEGQRGLSGVDWSRAELEN